VKGLPPNLPIYAAAVLAGAIIGTTFGINFAVPAILKGLVWSSSSPGSS
jgi:uncharacterized protein